MGRLLFSGKVFSEYAQFCLAASESPLDGLAGIRTDAATAIHLGVADEILAVGTSTKHGYILVNVWLFEQRPRLEAIFWDQVVEASITTSSGDLELISIGTEERLPHIAPGAYRVRVLSRGLDRGLEVGDGGDQYRLAGMASGSYCPGGRESIWVLATVIAMVCHPVSMKAMAGLTGQGWQLRSQPQLRGWGQGWTACWVLALQ